ncbi:MAG TPA: TonB-dependent receptor [Stellaceae bacterium]|nr:TonB-dependent receptor [Stellaceae bacterium]
MHVRRHLLAGVAAAACLVHDECPALADTAPAATTAAGQLEEITVTAEKRAENINDVPISITALSPGQLASSVVLSTQQLEIVTPGLVFGDTNGFAQPYLRGIGTDLISPGQESPVAFYLDGVYLPFSSSLLQEFGDIERVEVLKGPQGTLYGRNTTAGAVNIITKDPGPGFTESASLSYGSYNYVKGVGYVAGGLTEQISASLSVIGVHRDGLFKILNTGDDADTLDEKGLRGKVKFAPNADWSFVVSGDWLEKDDSSGGVFTEIVGNNIPGLSSPATGPTSTPFKTYTDLTPEPHRLGHDWGFNLTSRGHFDWADLTAITGYRRDTMFSSADGDNTALPLLAFASDLGSKSFTQELQLASNDQSSRLQWLAGLYYLNGSATFGPVDVWAGTPITAAPAEIIYGASDIENYSAFGQASYAITDTLKAIAGLRYSFERRTFDTQDLTVGGVTYHILDLPSFVRPAFGAPANEDPDKSFASIDPKITLQYQSDGQMLYGSYSTAFKAGSYNLISISSPGPLNPERMRAFEVGGKHTLPFLNDAHLDWAFFDYRYRNIQVNIQDPGVGGIVAAQNAAVVDDRGVDIDFTIPISPNLRATIGAEYLDAHYTSFPNASVFNVVNGQLQTLTTGATISQNVAGRLAERAPRLTDTVALQWRLPTQWGDFRSTASWYHNSGFFFDPGNVVKQRAYDLVNLNIEFAPQDQNWTVALWANNLTDATVIQGINQTPYGIGAEYDAPRMIGFTISEQF